MECAICFEYFPIKKIKNMHTCSTVNCKCVICLECWTKITHKGKNIMNAKISDMPSIYDYFACPYCRNVDWKDYMNNVFNQLQQKVLGEKEFNKLIREKMNKLMSNYLGINEELFDEDDE